MADKKENLIEEEVKETKKQQERRNQTKIVLRAQPRSQEKARKVQKLNLQKKKSTGYSGKIYGKMQGNTCNSQEEKECP